MKTQHTPSPWTVSMPGGQTAFNGHRVTITHNGSMIADLDWNSPQENMGNAAFIVKACNCHDALLEACKRALKAIEALPPRMNEDRYEPLMMLQAAIAKAQE